MGLLGFIYGLVWAAKCNLPRFPKTGELRAAHLKRFPFNFPLCSPSLLHPVCPFQHKYLSFPEPPTNKELFTLYRAVFPQVIFNKAITCPLINQLPVLLIGSCLCLFLFPSSAEDSDTAFHSAAPNKPSDDSTAKRTFHFPVADGALRPGLLEHLSDPRGCSLLQKLLYLLLAALSFTSHLEVQFLIPSCQW